METTFSNHEIWRTCPYCGHEYDAHLSGMRCPKCNNLTQLKRVLARIAILLCVLGMMLMIFGSCATTKYKVRRHNNRLIQEVQQHQNSLSAGQDWTRAYRNWDRRPKSKWPFNFIQ